jgi:hypothetical protein
MPKRYRKHSKSLIEKEIDDECVIVDTLSGNVHQLNPAAACIWRNLEHDMDIMSLARILHETFKVDMVAALADAETCVTELCDLGLIEICQKNNKYCK